MIFFQAEIPYLLPEILNDTCWAGRVFTCTQHYWVYPI